MTKQEWQKFHDMVREFESMPDKVVQPKATWLKPVSLKHLYEITFYYCDGTTETINVCVDIIAIRSLINYLASCGLYAKAKLLER